jgi:hypothetical protein
MKIFGEGSCGNKSHNAFRGCCIRKICRLAAVAEVWGLGAAFLIAQTNVWWAIDQNSGWPQRETTADQD